MVRPVNVHLVSLGCPKNLVDSEVILGRLGEAGHRVTPYPELADVLMVNTCSFIDSAKEESVNTILELAAYKEEDPGKQIVIAGCLGQRYPEDLLREVPEIDAIVGLSEYQRVGAIIEDLVGDERRLAPLQVQPPVHPSYSEGSRLRLTPRHTTYLRISEGCDNPCTFCAIPSFRGRFRSKPLDTVIAEAQELIASGATELNLISQDLTSYGLDLTGRYQLAELLERLDALDGLRWIRLLYAYPKKFSEEMIAAVADLDRVVPYIDMPIQHIHDKTLRRMGRRMGERDTKQLFDRMRERIPGLVLRTTFIVGFPGETEEEFETLEQFVRDYRIERVGVFPYSDEDGTPATRLKEKVSEAVALERQERLMLAQQEIAFEYNRGRVGEVVDVLIDGVATAEPDGEPQEEEAAETDDSIPARLGRYGRSYAEAPEIDARIFLPEDAGEVGAYVRMRITATDGYDLEAEPLGE